MAKPEGQAFEVIRVIEDPEVLGKGVGAMFRKGDPLKAKVDEAIRAVYANGTVSKLQENGCRVPTSAPTSRGEPARITSFANAA